MAWCHRNVDRYIPSEPGLMGCDGRLYVIYYTERHSIATWVQHVMYDSV